MSETVGEAGCIHIFSFKMVDNNLVQNVTYPTAGSKMIQKCLKIWDKMSDAITASLCTSLTLWIHNIVMAATSDFFILSYLDCMNYVWSRNIAYISCICVIAGCCPCVFWRRFRGKMHQRCCLPYPIQPTMDSSSYHVCFAYASQYSPHLPNCDHRAIVLYFYPSKCISKCISYEVSWPKLAWQLSFFLSVSAILSRSSSVNIQ